MSSLGMVSARLVGALSAVILLGSGCTVAQSPGAQSPGPKITSFEECVAAGNVIRRTLPPSCMTRDGATFIEGKSPNSIEIIEDLGLEGGRPLEKSPGSGKAACRDLCGDGECQEIVCMAVGCPRPESAASCPKDC